MCETPGAELTIWKLICFVLTVSKALTPWSPHLSHKSHRKNTGSPKGAETAQREDCEWRARSIVEVCLRRGLFILSWVIKTGVWSAVEPRWKSCHTISFKGGSIPQMLALTLLGSTYIPIKEPLWLQALLERDRVLSWKFDFNCDCSYSFRNSFETVNPLFLPSSLNSLRIKVMEKNMLLNTGKWAGALILSKSWLIQGRVLETVH